MREISVWMVDMDVCVLRDKHPKNPSVKSMVARFEAKKISFNTIELQNPLQN
jgi:hypothetical protein